GSYIGEGSVAVVAIESILTEVGDEEILKAVVVVVADADAHRPTGIEQAGLSSDVGERTIAIVLVKAIAGSGRDAFQAAATEDEDVHPAIVVVIEEGATAAHDFRNVGCTGAFAVEHRLRESGTCGYIHKAGERKRVLGGTGAGAPARADKGRSERRRNRLQQTAPGPRNRHPRNHCGQCSTGDFHRDDGSELPLLQRPRYTSSLAEPVVGLTICTNVRRALTSGLRRIQRAV